MHIGTQIMPIGTRIMGIGTQIMGINTQNMPIGTRARYLLFSIELTSWLICKGFLVSIFWNIYTNKIKKKKYTEASIRKNETQHRNEGSFEEFIESEKKRRRARYKKNIDKNLDVNLPNPITRTINLLLEINENVALKEEFETFQLINYYSKNEYIQ